MPYRVLIGDGIECINKMKDSSVDCCIVSPPRYCTVDSVTESSCGSIDAPERYVERLVYMFREVRRILKDDGTLWVNMSDVYRGDYGSNEYNDTMASIYGVKTKDLIGIPWMLAFALRDDGWYLRQDIIWYNPSCADEPISDRCIRAHEYIFLLTKNSQYYFNSEAIEEEANYDGRKDTVCKGSAKYRDGEMLPSQKNGEFAGGKHERWRVKDGVPIRNKRDVWTVCGRISSEDGRRVLPTDIIDTIMFGGCRDGGTVLCIGNK